MSVPYNVAHRWQRDRCWNARTSGSIRPPVSSPCRAGRWPHGNRVLSRRAPAATVSERPDTAHNRHPGLGRRSPRRRIQHDRRPCGPVARQVGREQGAHRDHTRHGIPDGRDVTHEQGAPTPCCACRRHRHAHRDGVLCRCSDRLEPDRHQPLDQVDRQSTRRSARGRPATDPGPPAIKHAGRRHGSRRCTVVSLVDFAFGDSDRLDAHGAAFPHVTGGRNR